MMSDLIKVAIEVYVWPCQKSMILYCVFIKKWKYRNDTLFWNELIQIKCLPIAFFMLGTEKCEKVNLCFKYDLLAVNKLWYSYLNCYS